MTFHRHILTEAWQSAWNHKRLWLFGLLAGLVNSGSVLQIVATHLRPETTQHGLRGLLESSIAGATTVFLYVQKLTLTSPTRLTVTVSCILLGLLIVGFLAVCAQAELIWAIPALDRKKKTPPFFSRSWKEIGRVLTIDAVFRLTLIALSVLATVLFGVLSPQTIEANVVLNFALLTIFVPLTLLASYLSIFTVIEAIVNDLSVSNALGASLQTLRRHWLIMSELGVLLFFIHLLFSVAALVLLLLFAVPYLLLLKGIFLTGSFVLWISLVVSGVILLTLLLGALFGLMTALTYAVWFHAYERVGKKPSSISKIERIIKRLTQQNR